MEDQVSFSFVSVEGRGMLEVGFRVVVVVVVKNAAGFFFFLLLLLRKNVFEKNVEHRS